ncbi:MAG: hypothetical protein RLY70_1920 [Planctomycetota bacterium]
MDLQSRVDAQGVEDRRMKILGAAWLLGRRGAAGVRTTEHLPAPDPAARERDRLAIDWRSSSDWDMGYGIWNRGRGWSRC